MYAKSVKTAKHPKSKTSKVFSVDITTDDDTTDYDSTASGDVPTSSASDDVLSYATKAEKVVVFSKTSKEAKVADDESGDDADSGDVDAKASKVAVAKVVRAISVDGTTGAATSVNAAENASVNAAVINGAGTTLFAVLTFASVGAMMA